MRHHKNPAVRAARKRVEEMVRQPGFKQGTYRLTERGLILISAPPAIAPKKPRMK